MLCMNVSYIQKTLPVESPQLAVCFKERFLIDIDPGNMPITNTTSRLNIPNL